MAKTIATLLLSLSLVMPVAAQGVNAEINSRVSGSGAANVEVNATATTGSNRVSCDSASAPTCEAGQKQVCKNGVWNCEASALREKDACRAKCRNDYQNNQSGLEACFRACSADREREVKENLQEKRAQLKTSIDAKRVELKTRLAKVKDANKQKILERVYDMLNKLNEKLTAHFSNVLEKLQNILDRAEERARNKLSAEAMARVQVEIEAASSAITEAQAAVAAQASQSYTITITDETKLKGAVGEARKMLHDDLKAVEEKVRAAREAVREVLIAIAQEHKVEASATATTE